MKKIFLSFALGLASLLPVFLMSSEALAASATLYLSPAGGSVSQGSYLTVNVYENSGGEPVNGVQANLSYPANLLDFVSISSSSAFSIVAQSSGGGGTVQIGRGALPAVSGAQLVASVRFKAKTNSGTASVSFAGGSSVVSANSNSNIMSGSSGGNYTLTSPPPAAIAPPKDTTAPAISDVKVSEVGPASAVVSWTTSEPSTSEVNYGLSTAYGLAAVDANMVTNHKVTLSSPLISQGTIYHFAVKSADPAGNAATGSDQTFTTIGATLVVTVKNLKNQPLKGAKVELAGKTAETDAKGQATLTGLKEGTQSGSVTYHNTVKGIRVDINQAGKTPQTLNVTLKPAGSAWPLILLLVAALAGAAYILRAHPEFMPNRVAHWHPGNRNKDPRDPNDTLNPPSKQPPPNVIKPGPPKV